MQPPAFKTLLNDLLIAVSLLTRLPAPEPDWADASRPLARAAWAYPLAGILAALPAVLAGAVGQGLGLPPMLVAGLMLGLLVLVTGAMHEDGLADCADGFWGGWDKERRLEIMKDSAIGTYGVCALVFVIGLKWGALGAILSGGVSVWLILVPAAMSRAGMVWVMQALPNARDTGLSQKTGKPGWASTYVALAVGLIVALFGIGFSMFWITIAGILTIWVFAYVARQKVGGQTGDVLGASQTLSEMVLLAGLAAHFT